VEPVQVDQVRLDPQLVPAWAADQLDRQPGQHPAQPADIRRHHPSCVAGWCLVPHPVDQQVRADRSGGLDEQYGQHDPLFRWPQLDPSLIGHGIERPQELEHAFPPSASRQQSCKPTVTS
jgi:hypothetical protein